MMVKLVGIIMTKTPEEYWSRFVPAAEDAIDNQTQVPSPSGRATS